MLRAAGVQVLEWDEDALPSVVEARELFIPKRATRKRRPASRRAGAACCRWPRSQEVLADGDATDYGQLEPVPSAFFED